MPSERYKGSKIRILLCDDHAIVREGTKRLLQEEPDMEIVGEACDGLEAIEMVKRLSPDVVAMDVSMPRMNGIEATKKIKEINPNCVVLALTAYDDVAYVTRLIENGASGYILKTARSEELAQAVRASYAGESIIDAKLMKEIFSRIAQTGQKLFRASRDTGGSNEEPGSFLTGRELSVLKFLANGLSNKEIASRLDVSPRTIQSHLASVFSKLGVSSRTGAVVTALKKGLISADDIEVKAFE